MRLAAAASGAFFNRKKPFLSLPSISSLTRRMGISTATAITNSSAAALTEEELEQINDVVPRLCSSNHLKEAVQLVSAALSTDNPPLSSLPLSILVNRLTREPDLAHPMHLLNSLKYNSSSEKTLVIVPIAKMFVTHFFQQGQPKRAVKIFQWVSRPDFPGGLAGDLEFYAVLVDGLCKRGMILECLRVLQVMAGGDLVIGREIRMWVYRGLLREARVKEALDLNAALDCNTLSSKELVDLMNTMIADWVD